MPTDVSLKFSSSKLSSQRTPKITVSDELNRVPERPKELPLERRSKFSSMKQSSPLNIHKEVRSAEFLREIKGNTPTKAKKTIFAELKKPAGDDKADLEEGPLKIVLSPKKNKASPQQLEAKFRPKEKKSESSEISRERLWKKLTPTKALNENISSPVQRERRSSFAPANRWFHNSPARQKSGEEIEILRYLRAIARQAYALDIDLTKSCTSL